MRFTRRPKPNIILVAVSACLLLLAVIGTTFGAYTSQAAKRGVVRNRDTDKIRFTSNYLQPYGGDTDKKENFPARVVAFSEDATQRDSIDLDIWVYNYIVGSNGQINERDITYDMTIQIVDGSKNSYTVKNSDTEVSGTNNTYTISNLTLTGRKESQNKFTVTIAGADLNKIKIYAKAVPRDTSATGNQIIAATIIPSTASSVQGFAINGDFTDKTAYPNQFDGFNYEVSITSGAASVTLKWDKNAVEIDPFFLKKIGADNTSTTAGTVTFQMDQAAGTGTYLIPFYIKNKSKFERKVGETTESISWDEMKNIISVTGEQIATQALNP